MRNENLKKNTSTLLCYDCCTGWPPVALCSFPVSNMCLEHDEQVTHISYIDNKDSKTHVFDRCKGIKLCTKIGLHKDAYP